MITSNMSGKNEASTDNNIILEAEKNSPAMYCTTTVDGVIIGVDQKLIQTFGYNEKELKGKNVSKIFKEGLDEGI